MKNKTPFDNFIFTTATNVGLFNRLHIIITARHKFIPNFEFQESFLESHLFTSVVNKIYSNIYLMSKYGIATNIPVIDIITNQPKILKTGAWDEEKQEWYVVDSENNKQYESEFIPNEP